MNVGNPELAFEFAQLPNAGVGLARLEFIINNDDRRAPARLLEYPKLPRRAEGASRGRGARLRRLRSDFFREKMVEGVATIAAAFWPKPVIVRLSDFKSNEYRKLLGGERYEPEEENPMLGFRGASRYIAQDFRECFELECAAMQAGARRARPHQRRADGAVRAHARRSGASRSNCWPQNGLERGQERPARS